ncbi:response regulator transcription factor [Paenibacillus aceris]|uniref:Two-component system response regulator YesN n=1 Tax=Paenibacillus aceris TaxID=869555 RepID=A0ABS4I214_9BACL|nr:response regulator [Paenibacillus aceris]MBP1964954.1 two-component system response regulator YesN [Paenibacillus aceris]NHW35615.1 response regulator [Paenibacillus aceris]
MKMLIVDDEIQIRTGLQQGIDWRSLGLQEVFIADNGVSALELYKQHVPEIVITDIRMPKMDGLTLIKSVREISSDCKFIILSGYSEFEYAKKALQYEVLDYELKPVNIKRLLTVVKKAIEKIKSEKSQISLFDEYLSDRLFHDVVNNDFKETPNVKDFFSQSLKWKPGSSFRICYLQIDENQENIYKKESKERLQQILKEEAKKIPGIIHSISLKNYMLIMNSENRVFELEKWWNHLNDIFKCNFACTISIGVSNEEELDCLPVLYQQALQAIQTKLYSGPSGIHYFFELQRKEDRTFSYKLPEEEIWKGFQEPSFSVLKTCIGREFSVFQHERRFSRKELTEICKQYLHVAEQVIMQKFTAITKIFETDFASIEQLDQLDTLNDYRDFTIRVFEGVYDKLQYVHQTSGTKGTKAALKYIQNHFHEDISVKEVSDHIQQSPNYFSHKFKQEMSLSFTEYLNGIRIEEAIRLLKTEVTIPLYEISSKVGFQDYKYFTHVFKKMKGLSPSEYQKNMKQ